jgi:hypothetical protein
MLKKSPEEYLEFAHHAEQAAAESQTPQARNSWLTIAVEYRTLAAEKLKAMQASQNGKKNA